MIIRGRFCFITRITLLVPALIVCLLCFCWIIFSFKNRSFEISSKLPVKCHGKFAIVMQVHLLWGIIILNGFGCNFCIISYVDPTDWQGSAKVEAWREWRQRCQGFCSHKQWGLLGTGASLLAKHGLALCSPGTRPRTLHSYNSLQTVAECKYSVSRVLYLHNYSERTMTCF